MSEHFTIPVSLKDRKEGSALLLTLLVVSLLLVIVLSFTVYVRISLRELQNQQDLFLARANAKLGANLALAELQKTLGPDMRVSARAEIINDENPDYGFSASQDMRFWTGAWSSEDWDPGNPSDRQNRFEKWLVSMPDGEESLADDETLVSTSPDFSNNTFFATVANVFDSNRNVDVEIRAGLQTLERMDASTGTPKKTGSYAWWVSDEGVKANIALADPYLGVSDPADVEDGDFDAEIPKFLFPHRPNLQLTDWFANLDFTESYGEQVSKDLEKASGLPGSAWLALAAAESDIIDNDDIKTALREDTLFSDYTFFSHGVMSSTRRGGLRGDLSLAFWQDRMQRYPTIEVSDTTTEQNRPFEEDFRVRRLFEPQDYDTMTQPTGGSNGDTNVGAMNPFGPRWEVLRDFHNSFHKITRDPDGYEVVRAASSDRGNSSGSYHEQPRRQSDDQSSSVFNSHDSRADRNFVDHLHNLGTRARDANGRGELANLENLRSPAHPVLTRYILEVRGTLYPNPNQDPIDRANNGTRYLPEIKIGKFATLWNPYNVAISLADNDGRRGGSPIGNENHGRMLLHLGTEVYELFEIEINGEVWDLGGGTNDETTGEMESILPKTIIGKGRKGKDPGIITATVGRMPFEMVDVRTESHWSDPDQYGGNPLINSDFEPGEVRLYGLKEDTVDPMTAGGREGNFATTLGKLTSYMTSPDTASSASFRKNFLEALGFMDETAVPPVGHKDFQIIPHPTAGFIAGTNVPFHFRPKQEHVDDTTRISTHFSGESGKEANHKPVHFLETELDFTIVPEVQAIRAEADAAVVSLGYLEFQMKSGSPTDPRDYLTDMEMQVPRFTHFNPRAFIASPRLTPSGEGQIANYWVGTVREGGRENYTDTERVSGPRSGLEYHKSYFGADHFPGDGRTTLTLFDIPRRPVESMGQYQHAMLSWLNNQPTYAFGNSLADIHVPMDSVIARYDDEPGSGTTLRTFMDLSWFLNDALWDDYFISTIDPYVDLNDPTIPRLRPQRNRFLELDTSVVYNRGDSTSPEDEVDYSEVAGNVLLRGAFNVNSTSLEAWKAILAPLGGNGISYQDPATASTETTDTLAFPFYRHSLPIANDDGTSSDTDPTNTPWTGGPRDLTDVQITALATAIVDEVRSRGPFFSISDFVNRRIGTDSRSQMGAIQAAIEAQGTSLQGLVEDFGTVDVSGKGPAFMSNLPNSIRNKPLAFAPGDLTQADILSSIAPVLAARSDTFIIRTFGSSGPNQQAIAWCEMIVQRIQEAVDADPLDPYTTGPFGREFKIVSMRYLDANDL